MTEQPAQRSVIIADDERTGWSSERPRRDGAPPRPPDVSVRGRVLGPSDRLRYSPGSLLVIAGAAGADPVGFADRVIEERGVVLAPSAIRRLLAGRVPEAEIAKKADELLLAAATKRLTSGQAVVIPLASLDAPERERFVRLAHSLKRPRHLILLDSGKNQVSDEERQQLDALRRALDAGEMGREGFQTSLRLGGSAIRELKRVVFQPAPRDG